MDAKPARLDAEGTAKGLTRIVTHHPAGACFGPSVALRNPEYEAESGERTTLVPTGEPIIVPSEEGETFALMMTSSEKDLLCKVLVQHGLLQPHDRDLCTKLRNKIQG